MVIIIPQYMACLITIKWFPRVSLQNLIHSLFSSLLFFLSFFHSFFIPSWPKVSTALAGSGTSARFVRQFTAIFPRHTAAGAPKAWNEWFHAILCAVVFAVADICGAHAAAAFALRESGCMRRAKREGDTSEGVEHSWLPPAHRCFRSLTQPFGKRTKPFTQLLP